MAAADAVAVAAEAADVDLHALPPDDAAVLDVELAVDVDRAALVADQQRQPHVGEVGVPARIVLAALTLARAAEMIAFVVAGDLAAAGAAEMLT